MGMIIKINCCSISVLFYPSTRDYANVDPLIL
jgi:hypothetical protein